MGRVLVTFCHFSAQSFLKIFYLSQKTLLLLPQMTVAGLLTSHSTSRWNENLFYLGAFPCYAMCSLKAGTESGQDDFFGLGRCSVTCRLLVGQAESVDTSVRKMTGKCG